MPDVDDGDRQVGPARAERRASARRAAPGLALLLIAAIFSGCSAQKAPPAKAEYSFWPPMPNEPRIQFLRSFRFSSDVEPPAGALDSVLFGSDRQVLPIAKPYGVAVREGRIYVCDITNPAVMILDLEKQQTRVMFARGVEQMAQPTAIAIAPDGMKYVVDRRLARIFVFNAEDRHVISFGHEGFTPVGAAVRGDELFVPDMGTRSVLVLDRFTGDVRRSIGEPDDFTMPLGVTTDAVGNVYVTDAIRGRLHKFSSAGEPIYAIGEIADAPGNFVRPKYLVTDREGVVYVVDAAFQNVQMFNEEGELLMFFGGSGPFPGSMSLPAGIAVDEATLEYFADDIHPAFEARGILAVTNQFGLDKVAVYAVGQLREGATMADIAPFAADVMARSEGPEDAAATAGAVPGEGPGGYGGSEVENPVPQLDDEED